jgi:hypothetical protein
MATDRIIENEYERKMLIRFIEEHELPMTVGISAGRRRSVEQNKLQRKWMMEIAEQLGDDAECWRGYCKLHIGVPILRNENDDFREKYDRVIRPLSYEHKLSAMMIPLDLPVTRIMTTKQKSSYLDGIIKYFGERGVILTMPEDKRFGRAA